MSWNKLKSFIKNYLLSRRAYQFFIRDWINLSDIVSAAEMMATLRFSRNLAPQVRAGIKAKRILVIAPHPDDETLGPGGTLLRAIREGAEVLCVYLTSGPLAQAETLKAEAKQISATFGYQTLFLDYYSQAIPLNSESEARLAQAINGFSPDVLLLPFCLDDHDDHRRASHLLLNIYRRNRLEVNFEIWAYQVYTMLLPNVVVDITDLAETKQQMIRLWQSQAQKRDWAHFSLGLNAFNQRFLAADAQARYAEAFFVLPLKEYMQYCKIYFSKNPADCYYASHYKEISAE